MANITMGLQVIQLPDGKFLITNTSTGQTNEGFTLDVTLKHSKGDKVLNVTTITTSMGWEAQSTEDGWYRFTLKAYAPTDLETPLQTYTMDSISLIQSYICLNRLLLSNGCNCDFDLDKWMKTYSKIEAVKAASCAGLYSSAQCMVENLQKICKGC